MAITAEQKYLLNHMNSVAAKVGLGDLLDSAGTVDTADITDLAVTTAKLAADAVTNAKIADGAVSLEHLDSGIAPSHIMVYAGSFTTAGGSATEAHTVTGAATTDVAICTLNTTGATPRVIVTSKVSATNTLQVVFDGDPSTDHQVNYAIFRAAS